MSWGPEETCLAQFVLGGIAVTALATCAIYNQLDQRGFFISATSTNVPTATRPPPATSLPSMVCLEIRPGGGAKSLTTLKEQGYVRGFIHFPPNQDSGFSKGFAVEEEKVPNLPSGKLCGMK